MARFPNAGYLRNEVYAEDPGVDGMVAPSIPYVGGDPVNAVIVVRTLNFQYENARVVELTGNGELKFQPDLKRDIGTEDWGFFLQGTRPLIDQDGEWGVEVDQGVPYVYYRSGDPNTAPVHVSLSRHERGIAVPNGSSGITVQGISFRGQFGAGITLGQCTGVTVYDCEFHELRRGIDDRSTAAGTGHVFDHNVFRECYDFALRSYANNTTITFNTFLDIGMVPGLIGIVDDPVDYPESEFGTYTGIFLGGSGYVVTDNYLDNIGNGGMTVNGTGVIQRNYLGRTVQTLNDAGAIQIDYCDGLEIRDNIIYKVGNLPASLESSSPEYENYSPINYGVYFGDHYIVNTTVDGNTVSGCDKGIHVDHNLCSESAVVTNNTLFGNTQAQLSITDLSNYRAEGMWDDQGIPLPAACLGDNGFTGLGAGANYRGTYTDKYAGNILYSLNSDQRCMELSQAWADSYAGTHPLVNFGIFDKNYFFNPFSDVPIFQSVQYTVQDVTEYLGPKDIPWTLRGWRAATGNDQHSLVSPLHLKDFGLQTETATNIDYDDDFDTGVADWLISGFCSPTSSDFALRSTNCTWIERGCIGCTEPIDANNVGTYVYRFRMRSEVADALRLAPVYQDQAGYRDAKYFGVSPEWRDYTMVVDVTDANSGADKIQNAFQNVQLGLGASTTSDIFLDDLTVKKCSLVTGYDAVIAEEHILRYNNPLGQDPNDFQDVNASFTLAGTSADCWSDVYGQIYAGGSTIDLEPWQSIVLFKLSNGFDITGGYNVSGDEVWTTDRSIKGSVVVPDGTSLTIDGATIGFADTRLNSNPLTNVVVQAGGTLRLQNGAVLTSVPGSACEASMWDGSSVQCSSSPPLYVQGNIFVISGARIENAMTAILVGTGDPVEPPLLTPQFGGVVVLDGAVFRNNKHDLVSPPQLKPQWLIWGPHVVRNSCFLTTRALAYPTVKPVAHLLLRNTWRTLVQNSRFENSSGIDPDAPELWGAGIDAFNTMLAVRPADNCGACIDEADRNRFSGLYTGIYHGQVDPSKTIAVDRSDFKGCAKGIQLDGGAYARITRNTFDVLDEPLTSPTEGSYGLGLFNSTGFEVEENTFTCTQPQSNDANVGLVLSHCGPESNNYYNNRFDGLYTGTVIMGENDGPLGMDGLQAKCNDHSNTTPNIFDIAITGFNVTIGGQQGAADDQFAPAGNTFAQNCVVDQHIHVAEGANSGLNNFTYWYHQFTANGEQVVPECFGDPITAPQFQPAPFQYDKPQVCPSGLSMMLTSGELATAVLAAENELVVLTEVYDNWLDGGEPEELIHYVENPNVSSYELRNQLMLVAPSVSVAIWEAVFERTPAMNPWHLAQALIANSPLEKDVLDLLEGSGLSEYYQILVENEQGDGMSMHSIMQSELAHYYGRQATALHDLTAWALLDTNEASLDTALYYHERHGIATSLQAMYGLLLAKGDLQRARQVLDSLHDGPGMESYFDVQDIYLNLLENEEDLEAADGTALMALQAIANTNTYGTAHARALLIGLGLPQDEEVILPVLAQPRAPSKPRKPRRSLPELAAYPNPSNGPVYLVLQTPDGVERVVLEVLDPQGRTMRTMAVSPGQPIQELDTRGWTNGLYAVRVEWDGIETAFAKFQLVR